jgi:sialic acid synthase SpsE
VPFVKIANRTDLRPLARNVTDLPIWVSYQSSNKIKGGRSLVKPLCCVSNYPAPIEAYESRFTSYHLTRGISDHTVGWELYHKYQPERYECHFVLEHDSRNPDAGPFARTPEDLEEVVG